MQDQFKKTGHSIFNHIIQIADNAGATDEHRALNYLAVRYDEIYHRTQLLQNENYSFTGVEIRPSRLAVLAKWRMLYLRMKIVQIELFKNGLLELM